MYTMYTKYVHCIDNGIHITKNIIQEMLRHFYSILHVTEFRDTLSYVGRTMSDKRSFEQLFCHRHSSSFAYNRLFAQMSHQLFGMTTSFRIRYFHFFLFSKLYSSDP